jgi:hypothetical protein
MNSQTIPDLGTPRVKRAVPGRSPTATVEPKVDQAVLSRSELRQIVLSILG